MQRRIMPALAVSAVILGLALPGDEAVAQTARDLVGTWTAVSITTGQGSNQVDLFGPNPRGILILGADGRYVWVAMRRELPVFASNVRTRGTPEENTAIVQGSLAQFGTYTVDEANRTLILRIEASTFPNTAGAEQRRPFTLSGDMLTIANPASSSGQVSQAVWRRAQ
ncbi:lipocalin-like domain-containing protein [Sabulicella rubraurantiaca]|uniref:lipocalin-like domain-containing protein n=1 Tax=Sabulicella rubraurantiaca TaxID=2811429 RepID=UPI001A97C91B|nr:lipocalin-like domain-containing protein [Sabulicella rubraurantiaca]